MTQLVVLCFAILTARADWQAALTVTSVAPDKAPVVREQGTMKQKGKRLRIDTTKPAAMSMIVNQPEKKAWMIMGGMAMETDFSKQAKTLPPCAHESNLEDCLLKQNFKRVGNETIDGHSCVIYEGKKETPNKKTMLSRIWHPTDLKEVPALRVRTWENPQDMSRYLEINYTDVKMVSLSDSLFTPPDGTKPFDASKFMQQYKGMKKPGGE
jgi:hypothetical protein